jgi:uncharacterized protein (DUF488 family)
VDLYTIGFTKKSAEQFFGLLRVHGVRRVIDIRLRNQTQLAGFTKKDDLAYFLRLHKIEYVHEPLLAPTAELLDAYRGAKRLSSRDPEPVSGPGGGRIGWEEYEKRFIALLEERRIEKAIKKSDFRKPSALLCSEPTPEQCHRRLVAEHLAKRWPGVTVHHL